MQLQEILRNCKVYVWRRHFVIIKARRPYPEAFANIIDKKEITVVMDQNQFLESSENEMENSDFIKMEKDWRIMTFGLDLPLDQVGFLAEVANVLAEAGVSIFILSTYSSNHILVKEKDRKGAEERLRVLGCTIEEM